MDVKVIILLIGLAVITNGCITSDSDRQPPRPPVYREPIFRSAQPVNNNPQMIPDRHPKPQNDYNINLLETPTTFQQTVKPTFNTEASRIINNDISKDIALNVLALSQELIQRKLESPSASKYEVLSPISITSALQLAFLGARGTTHEELKALLKYSSNSYELNEIHRQFGEIIKDLQTNIPNEQRDVVNWRQTARDGYVEKYMRGQSKVPNDSEHRIEMANGIFVQHDLNIREEYRKVVENIYQSDIKNLNFQSDPEGSSRTINEWVNEKTHGKIKEIVPKVINPNTKAVLANALYFNAEWQSGFINGVTSKKKFFPYGRNNQSSIFVNLMAHGGKFPHYYDNETNSDILGFPYKQNSTTMYVILPRDSSIDRVKEVQGELSAKKIDAIIDQMTLKTCVILFPKMHLSSSHYLKPELEKMGAVSLFDSNTSDLSLLTDQKNECPPNSRYIECNNIKSPNSQKIMFPRNKRSAVSYKTPSEDKDRQQSLRVKDFFVNKRLEKKDGSDKKKKRSKRDTVDDLETLRINRPLTNPGLFADEVIHKVDLSINEKGTEGGAATAITLNRSGPQVTFRADVPFLFVIRHDPTKIPLFYGVVFEPPYEEEPPRQRP